MTISQLARLNKANGGYFFDRDTMRAFGETRKSFTIEDHPEYPAIAVLRNKRTGQCRYFSKTTGRITYMTGVCWVGH